MAEARTKLNRAVSFNDHILELEKSVIMFLKPIPLLIGLIMVGILDDEITSVSDV